VEAIKGEEKKERRKAGLIEDGPKDPFGENGESKIANSFLMEALAIDDEGRGEKPATRSRSA